MEGCGVRARDRPGARTRLFVVEPNGDGTVDIFLDPVVQSYETDVGVREYDASVRVVRGIVPWPGMIDDIRGRFDVWRECGEAISL